MEKLENITKALENELDKINEEIEQYRNVTITSVEIAKLLILQSKAEAYEKAIYIVNTLF